MARLDELNGWELTAVLVEIAEPIGNLAGDDELWETFKECTKNGLRIKEKDTFRFLLLTYAKMIPLLMGDRHKADTFRILSAVEGKPVSEFMNMNGKDLMAHITKVFNEQLTPFFIKSALSGQQG